MSRTHLVSANIELTVQCNRKGGQVHRHSQYSETVKSCALWAVRGGRVWQVRLPGENHTHGETWLMNGRRPGKEAWATCFREGNGLCEDLVVRKSKKGRRNRKNYDLVSPACKGGSGYRDGGIRGQSTVLWVSWASCGQRERVCTMGSTEGRRNGQIIPGCSLESQLELARRDVVRLMW